MINSLSRDFLKEILAKYRDPKLANKIVFKINEYAKDLGDILIMHVCGTHEWTITHYGIRSLLPNNIEVRAGPGCPVCITPASDIDSIIELCLENNVSIIAYGDMSRARGSKGLSLEDAKSMGLDLRIVYSIQDAYSIAINESDKKFIFFGVGFDTTAPSTAYMVLKGIPKNLSIISCYRYIPPAVGALLSSDDLEIDGLINPGHSSTVTGMSPYKKYFDKYPKPMVFAGFEPIDVLISIYMILKQIKNGEPKMENEYTRSVTWNGNVKAMDILFKVFNVMDGVWRGIGVIEESAFEFKDKFKSGNARAIYNIEYPLMDIGHPKGCRCADVIKGKITPLECPLYMNICRPEKPIGPCMVSIEGTCRIWAEHKVIDKLNIRG